MKSTLFGVWCLAWLVVAALLLAPLTTPVDLQHSDLVAHFFLFGCMAFGAVGFSHRSGLLTIAALATIAGGTALEFGQSLVPFRTFDILDMGANALGAMVGYALALTVLQLVIRPAVEARQANRTAGA